MLRTAVLIGASSFLAFGAMADEVFPPDLPSTCNLDNVAGTYGFNEDSLTSARTGEPNDIAAVGIFHLHPEGGAFFQAKFFTERGGELRTSSVYEGEWTVEENCFGFIDFPEFGEDIEIDFAFVAVENATELFLIRNNPLEEADAKLLFRK